LVKADVASEAGAADFLAQNDLIDNFELYKKVPSAFKSIKLPKLIKETR